MSPHFPPGDRLIQAPPKQLGQDIPEPLHHRITQLCELAYQAGLLELPTKAHMVGALVFGGPDTPEELLDLLDRYAKAKVADAMVDKTLPEGKIPDGSVIDLPRRTSGPRSPGQPGAVVRPSDEAS